MITSKTLAKIVLSFGSVSNKKLQKICYYVYSWYLVVYNESLTNTGFEAWVHGPVSREIYNEYKNYGWDNIPEYKGLLLVDNDTFYFCKKVVNHYMKYSGDELEAMTHNEVPWKKTREGCKKYEASCKIIPDEYIKEYYGKDDILELFR